jgi:hypothetical protein
MNTIKKALKQVLVDLAADDKLPLDFNQLDENIFNEALQPVVKCLEALYNDCEMALNGDWDKSDSGFENMQVSINMILL